MSVWGRVRKSTFGVLVFGSMLLLACGGGAAKPKPMVADPLPEGPDYDWSGGDAGVASIVGDDASSSSDVPASSSEGPSGAAILQGNEDGARALLAQFIVPNADHLALTRSLRPTARDYSTLFDAKAAAKIEAAQANDWDSNKAVIQPKSGQTEIKVWGATGSDLAKGTGNSKEFPGGYKKVARHLAPGVLFFRFKFVEPGKDVGTAYDGLAFVNGHWVIAPKPWRAMDGRAGPMEDEAESASERPEKPAKPAAKHVGKKKKPKGKKKK